MSAYTDAVEQGLKGLQAVSVGLCPGCKFCASKSGFGADLDAFRKA